MDVVLGAGWPGVMLHEAVGHGLEGDFNRKKTSAFAGLMGQQVAAKGVTVVDDGTMPERRGSLTIDDEGTPTNRTVLIEDGILVGYMQDRQNARLMGMKPTGNGRRESYAHVPMPRMTNTYMLAGERDPQEIIASVKNGLYAVTFGGGQVDITSGKYVFQCTEAYKIENGKVAAPVKGAMLIGNGPTDLHRITHDRQRLRARSRHRHLRQERPGRAGRRRPADAAHGPHHRRRHRLMSEHECMTSPPSRVRGWAQVHRRHRRDRAGGDRRRRPRSPSRSTCRPARWSRRCRSATSCWRPNIPMATAPHRCPLSSTLPNTARIFGDLPKRGDVVVFRWPGDRSQVWVKRVIGLPGDRIACATAASASTARRSALTADGIGEAEDEDGGARPAARFIETLPDGRSTRSSSCAPAAARQHARDRRCRRAICSSWATTATTRPTAACRVRDGGVGLLPVDDLVGRVDAWSARGTSRTDQPMWTMALGLRLSRFFTAVQSRTLVRQRYRTTPDMQQGFIAAAVIRFLK